jgi:MFS family permease
MALEETPVFLELSKNHRQSDSPLLNNFRDPQTRKRMFLLFFCISAGGAVLFFCVQVYTAIFLKTSVRLPSERVDQLSIYATLILFPLTIFAGWLSDKIGRKAVVTTGLFLGSLLILPVFQQLQSFGAQYLSNPTQLHNLYFIGLLLCTLSLALALVVGPQTAMLAELFPAKTRNSAATLPHNLAAGWIGGLLPLIVTWLNQYWNNQFAGLWYPMVFLGLAGICSLLYLPETREINLND